MNSVGHLSSRFLQTAAIVSVFTWAASALLAYQQTLDETDIMKAYYLGQHHDSDFRRFQAGYEKTFPTKSGIHMSRLAVRTPYYNLVQSRHDQGDSVTEIDFRNGYLAHPDTSFTAVLGVDTKVVTPPIGLDSPDGPFWRAYKFELSQDGLIRPRNVSAASIIVSSYDSYANTYTQYIVGAELYLNYDVQDIPSNLTHLKATAPDGTAVAADFDLNSLR